MTLQSDELVVGRRYRGHILELIAESTPKRLSIYIDDLDPDSGDWHATTP